MGNTNKKQLTIITVNYSGILLSPFEFYSEEFMKEESELSKIFEGILSQTFKEYKKQSFKWNLGKIDQKMQKERYTPIYHPQAGIVDNKIINAAQFQKLWEETFDKNIKTMKQMKYTQDQKKRASQFDLICFKTILKYVYKEVNFQNTSNLNPEQYRKFMAKMFDKSFLNENKKIAKTLDALEKQQVDIAFVQQSNECVVSHLKSKEYIDKYSIFKDQKCQSMILIRKGRFKKIHHSQQSLKHIKFTQENALNWNDDVVVAFVDNLILISGHLSSKKQKNQPQVKQLKHSLQLLQQVYPSCHIIVGCDANSYVSDLSKGFNIYPLVAEQYTTCKKRTFLQPQVNKAQQVALACRDHLISNLQLINAKICTIQNKPSHVGKQFILLPCEEHPFDHFVVRAQVSTERL